jgi:hypothetical protein
MPHSLGTLLSLTRGKTASKDVLGSVPSCMLGHRGSGVGEGCCTPIGSEGHRPRGGLGLGNRAGCPLLSLNMDCWSVIMASLDVGELARLSLVCKGTLQVSNDVWPLPSFILFVSVRIPALQARSFNRNLYVC